VKSSSVEVTDGFHDLPDYGLTDLSGAPSCCADDDADNRCDNKTDASILDHCLTSLAIAKVDPDLLETDLQTEQCVVVHDDLHCWLVPLCWHLVSVTISKVGGRVPQRVGAGALSCGLLVRRRWRQPDGDRLGATVDLNLGVGAVEIIFDGSLGQK